MSEKVEKAVENYSNKKYNCAQSVLCAYADIMGISEETAFRMAEAFGGGMGGMGSTCGAVNAMFTVLSYCNSDGLLEKGATKATTYRKIREASAAFEEEYGSIVCREILKGDSPKAKQCAEKVRDAALIIEKMAKGKGVCES